VKSATATNQDFGVSLTRDPDPSLLSPDHTHTAAVLSLLCSPGGSVVAGRGWCSPDMGILVDSDLVMRTHVCRTVSICFTALHQLRSIRHLVSATVFQSLVAALVLCRLDYGNDTLVGLPAFLVRRLQSVQNAAARLVFRLRRSDHVMDALVSLHWLRVPERITFKVTILTYRALHDDVPQ